MVFVGASLSQESFLTGFQDLECKALKWFRDVFTIRRPNLNDGE